MNIYIYIYIYTYIHIYVAGWPGAQVPSRQSGRVEDSRVGLKGRAHAGAGRGCRPQSSYSVNGMLAVRNPFNGTEWLRYGIQSVNGTNFVNGTEWFPYGMNSATCTEFSQRHGIISIRNQFGERSRTRLTVRNGCGTEQLTASRS